MATRRQRSWTSWIGIVLVLANLLAPATSHALRAQALPADSRVADLCHTAVVPLQPAPDFQPGPPGDADDALAHLDACSFCAHAPMSLGLWVPAPKVWPAASPAAAHPEGASATLRLHLPWALARSRGPPTPA